MSTDEAEKLLLAAVAVTREDIARAKAWLLNSGGGRTDHLVEDWLAEQKATLPRNATIDLMAPDPSDQIAGYARAFSVRLAFYQAQWELISAGEMFPAEGAGSWTASLGFRSGGHSGGLRLNNLGCSFPGGVERPPLAPEASADPDVFLRGVDCKTLHGGIREAIEQALLCFRRGLYMPATAMLAAAAEATWTECGASVAKKLANAKLDATVSDPYASISKKVTEIRKALEGADGKALLKTAGRSVADVVNAEVWTTALRERRNALHWGKAKSFVADHSETASLLMGAPLHVGTLEAIRAAG
jgi:hypothetical protein